MKKLILILLIFFAFNCDKTIDNDFKTAQKNQKWLISATEALGLYKEPSNDFEEEKIKENVICIIKPGTIIKILNIKYLPIGETSVNLKWFEVFILENNQPKLSGWILADLVTHAHRIR